MEKKLILCVLKFSPNKIKVLGPAPPGKLLEAAKGGGGVDFVFFLRGFFFLSAIYCWSSQQGEITAARSFSWWWPSIILLLWFLAQAGQCLDWNMTFLYTFIRSPPRTSNRQMLLFNNTGILAGLKLFPSTVKPRWLFSLL